jgi:hypothetical protein
VRSYHVAERDAFLSWIARRAAPPSPMLPPPCSPPRVRPKCSPAATQSPIPRSSGDALLPTEDPLAALVDLVGQLSEAETSFLEGGSETYLAAGRAFSRPPTRGGAWAASLAVAMRPQLFAPGAAPLALAGLLPREAFQLMRERSVPAILTGALLSAATAVRTDIIGARAAIDLAKARLAKIKRSSRAHDAWLLLAGSAPHPRRDRPCAGRDQAHRLSGRCHSR